MDTEKQYSSARQMGRGVARTETKPTCQYGAAGGKIHFDQRTSLRKMTQPFLILSIALPAIIIHGCVPAGVSISTKVPVVNVAAQTPESDMTPFEFVSLQMGIPKGWQSIKADSVEFENPQHHNMVTLARGKRDFVSIWRDMINTEGDPAKAMEDELDQYAPLHEHIRTLVVEAKEGPDVLIFVWRAYHVHNGKKAAFTVYTGYKPEPVFDPHAGVIRLFGRCASVDSLGTIEKDITKIAEYVRISELNKDKDNRISQALAMMKFDKTVSDAVASVVKADSLWSRPMQKVIEQPVSWSIRVPARSTKDVTDARFVTPRHLFLSYEGRTIAMVDTRTHTRLWHHVRGDTICLFAYGDKERVIVCWYGGPGSCTLQSFETVSGKEQWTSPLGGVIPRGWLTVDWSGVVIAVQQEEGETRLTALDTQTGRIRWETTRSHSSHLANPPFPLQIGKRIVMFYDGIESISPTEGANIWKNDEVRLDDRSPVPRATVDTLVVVDQGNTLWWLDAKSGTALRSVKLRTSATYSSCFPARGRIYLRGKIEDSDDSQSYFIDAITSPGGESAWSCLDSVPTVSNLIDDGRRVYGATWKGLIALNRESGKQLFAVDVTEFGRSFPASIRKYGDTLVYVGELVIAGVDALTGVIRFKHGFDPVAQNVHLDALDIQCQRLGEYLEYFGTAGRQGLVLPSGTSNYFFDQSRASQERSTTLARVSEQSYARFRWSGSQSDYYKSQVAWSQKQIESSYENMQTSIGMMFLTLENVQGSMAAFTAPERKRLGRVLESFSRLRALYEMQEFGDYVVRIATKKDFCNLAVVHLPSGTVSRRQLMRADRVVGVEPWASRVIPNSDQNLLYYHELRMVPAQKVKETSSNKVKLDHAVYLVADSWRLKK